MIVKKHLLDDNTLMLAICDEELSGKKIDDGEKQLDLRSEFYKGETMSEGELGFLVKEARIINAVGEKSVKFLQAHEIVEKVSYVKETPYAQVTYL